MKILGETIIGFSVVAFIVSMGLCFGKYERPSVGAPLYIASLVGILIGTWLAMEK